MAGEDVVDDGTWTGHEDRVADTPLIRVVTPETPESTRSTLRRANEVVRSLPTNRRR